jgi:ketosteroid isomerase-like protein
MIQFIVLSVAEADDTTTEQSVLDFQTARFNAMVNADLESLEDLLAEDLTYTHTTGWIETKSEFLSTVESGRIDYVAVTPREVNVRIYGDIAVLTGLSRMQGKVGDRAVDFTIRFTDVSRRIGNSWQLVAWQSAKLPAADE